MKEIGKKLEDFNSEMFHTFSLQMDAKKIKIKWKELERALVISSQDAPKDILRMSSP